MARRAASEEGKRIGLALRTLRRERKLTQTEVAYCFGMTVDGYRLYERGETSLRTESLPDLAKCLGVELATLAQRIGLGTGGESGPPEPDLEDELVRLTGKRSGVALAGAIRDWKRIPPSAQELIIATLRDAKARANEPQAPEQK